MKNEIPTTITRTVFFLLFFLFFFGTIATKAQKINQFTKDNKRTGIWKKYYTNKRIRYEGTLLMVKRWVFLNITILLHRNILQS